MTLLFSSFGYAQDTPSASQETKTSVNETLGASVSEVQALPQDVSELNVDIEEVSDSALAQAKAQLEGVNSSEAVADKPLKIGKHVNQEIDLLSMTISLSVVLLIILVSAFLLKRVQGGKTSLNGLKLVSSLHLGTKEKVVVVQAGKQQWLLGVTPHQINVLSELAEPLNEPAIKAANKDDHATANNVPSLIAHLFNKPK